MIDTHCHIDMYSDPHKILAKCESKGITAISVTNLPSHFEVGFNYFLNLKNVRIALGFHPLYNESFELEYPKFIDNLNKTSYIGEIGLDFSDEGKNSKEIQLKYFNKIIELVSDKRKILSIHSRKAEGEVLEVLKNYKVPNAIFHWYSGSQDVLKSIVNEGYFFSVNYAMINSINGKKIIDTIPKGFLLTESDGPFIKVKNRFINPWDVIYVYDYLSKKWNLPLEKVTQLLKSNFFRLINSIK